MKKLMSILFIAVFFASCSSDDDNDAVESSIVGAWTLKEANVENPMDINGDGTADPNFMNEVPCFVGTLSFTGDGIYAQTFSNLIVEEVNGEISVECDGTVASTGTYSLNGDQLTVTTTGPDPTTETRTIDLNGNTLKGSIQLGDFGNVELVYNRN
ncbi:hypothetical protein Aeqsu_0966 [Aequorivita sublithincola DSM 14238]|uniref:Lipocalin-like domain-containing protein n=1 Tax=Aequorivita sublithincola (strain DSM 14238 / LMG 21431 / ACAM 643 / 9-3) TaxID=746697 RepID=I3YTZ9_AEQSU|nr:lipocalin family protein [Aequorivita sublithincola]AFL80467.1 hypothetical protein Aeqsu_0966 [Aequorivita sublithincola DSM 14238]